MEELQKESTKNKLISEKVPLLKGIESKNEKLPNSEVKQENKENIKLNKNPENNNQIENEQKKENGNETEPLIDPKKELEKIKLSHIKQYSLFELLKKSLFFSTKNIKLPLFNIFKKFISQYLDLKIPIVYGKLLNSIIKEKNYDL